MVGFNIYTCFMMLITCFLQLNSGLRLSIVSILPCYTYPFASSGPTKGPTFACTAACPYNNTATHLNTPLEYYELKDD